MYLYLDNFYFLQLIFLELEHKLQNLIVDYEYVED